MLKPAVQGKRPVLLTTLPDEGPGQLARSEYEELEKPFKLEDIPLELRKTQARETFDRKGHLLQRYIPALTLNLWQTCEINFLNSTKN